MLEFRSFLQIPKYNQRFMPRLMPAKPTRYSFFLQAALGFKGVVWILVFFVISLVSGFLLLIRLKRCPYSTYSSVSGIIPNSFERLVVKMKQFSLKEYLHLPRLITGIVCVVFLLFSGSVFGQRTATQTGNWNSTATWGGQSVPTVSDAVIIPNGVSVTVNVNNAVCASLTINNSANGTGTLQFNSGSVLTVSASVTMGGTGQRVGDITMTTVGL